MKILVAPDSFKGSLSAMEICNITETVAKEIFQNCEVVKLPVADGGEGTVESILDTLSGKEMIVEVSNPLGKRIKSNYGIFNKDKAIIEMASASGLPLIKTDERNVLNSNTYGTGELILDAIKNGAKKIYLGIGGSATNDLGIGCLAALGVNFLDADKKTIDPIPANFKKIVEIDTSTLTKEVLDTEFVIMCDVKNPLLGNDGATYIYGKQKGITEKDMPEFEEGMAHICKVIEDKTKVTISNREGCGAAGGLGAGLLAFTNASIQSGVDTILEILEFNEKLSGSNLVITGEGRMDNQSAFGKVAFGVGSLCKANNIPCIALVGGLGDGYEDMYQHGITSIMTTTDKIMSIDDAIKDADNLCRKAIYRLLKMVQIQL